MTASSPKGTLLIVDDTPENIELLHQVLHPMAGELLVATNGPRALDLVMRRQPDLVLLDVMMPGMDGFEVCRRLKADPQTHHIPVIFVTARSEDIAAGFEAGGSDYITKPIDTQSVRARVRHQLERRELMDQLRTLNSELEDKVRERTSALTLANRQLRQEINERRYMQDRLSYMATHDFVTKLYNRNALDSHVSSLLARIQRDRSEAVFLLIDIDQFRLVNETCGCIAGDELLREFSQLVASELVRNDFFARLGGDKFAVVSDVEVRQGTALAHRIMGCLTDYQFEWEERTFALSAMIAVVPVTDKVVSFDQLMLMADEVAYLAKREGRGSVMLYQTQAPHGQDHRETVNWAFVLLDGLRHDRFRIHFQRLQPLSPDSVSAPENMRLEVLVRLWDEQRQSLVPPGQFIPAAERFNLVAELDRWVVRTVITRLGEETAWRGLAGVVAINLSPVSIREAGWSRFIQDLLLAHGVAPDRICFEITETEAIVNVPRARELILELKNLGCHFSLDDFGSGFASYGYLRDLPFDTVKIDGLFVRDMLVDDTHAAMVASMVAMAGLSAKSVVAECVESLEVALQLRALGVDWAQGFYFHRPEPLTTQALETAGRDAQRDATRLAEI